MTEDRLPDGGVGAHHELIFQAWRCVLGEGRATYLSGPITTGLRWVEAVEGSRGDVARHEVLAENSRAIVQTAARLRRQEGRVVIEPASLSVRSWSQDDYLDLWTALIERHADEVRLMPDWTYSIGCAREFARAVSHDIPVRLLDGAPVGAAEGAELLGKAAADLARRAIPAPLLEPFGHAISVVAGQIERDVEGRRARGA